ncbi:hypothetical protein [Furfurilactobacillus entadae]|uniref:hypothetical protein n=1 Tax=Furfurilactobacillus entadae TaxID=2922307 RepID=UPI0035EF3FA5
MKRLVIWLITVLSVVTLAAGCSKAADRPRATSHQSTTARTAHFPASFNKTWYGINADTKKLDQLTFAGNKLMSGDTTVLIHTVTNRTAADKAILSGKRQVSTTSEKNKRDHWAIYSSVTYKGQRWINLKGWYQSAGDGDFYRVGQETINGKKTPVLFAAGGADVWTNQHFYTSKRLANQMKDHHFEDDRIQSNN